ncbi:MAG: glutamine amidotransferase-related protein [Flavonifractor plautii]
MVTGDERSPGGQPRDPPGVGAFGAAARLRAAGMARRYWRPLPQAKPVLGICLGMQLLLERSFEYGEHPGLASFREVRPIRGDSGGAGLPHMGWNALRFPAEQPPAPFSRLWRRGSTSISSTPTRALPAERGSPPVEYGAPLTAAVQRETCTAPSSTRRRAGMWDCGFSRHSAVGG